MDITILYQVAYYSIRNTCVCRPQELDEAARRRFVKRLYIPLPGDNARSSIVKNLLEHQTTLLNEGDMQYIEEHTAGKTLKESFKF